MRSILTLILLLLASINLFAQENCEQYTPTFRDQMLSALDSFEIEMVEKGHLESRNPEGYLNFFRKYAPEFFVDLTRAHRPILDTTLNTLLRSKCMTAFVEESEAETVVKWELEQVEENDTLRFIDPKDMGKYLTSRIKEKDFEIKYIKNKLMFTAFIYIYAPDNPEVSIGQISRMTKAIDSMAALPDQKFEYELLVEIDSLDQIFINESISDTTDVLNQSIQFIKSHPLDGEIVYRVDGKASYNLYMKVLRIMNEAYHQLYVEESFAYFGKHYDELDHKDRKLIQKRIIRRIDTK